MKNQSDLKSAILEVFYLSHERHVDWSEEDPDFAVHAHKLEQRLERIEKVLGKEIDSWIE